MLTVLKFCLWNVSRSGFANYSTFREARILQKLIDKGSKKKNEQAKSTGKLTQEIIPINDTGEIPSRRVAMLNKIYVQALMDIMSSGKTSNDLYNLGIDITKVKLSNNLETLNIYWVSHNSVDMNHEMLKNLLNSTASQLQYHITLCRFSGKVPRIRFVRDLRSQNYLKLQNLLLTLKDEELTDPSRDPTLKEEETSKIAEEDVVTFRQDVFGLDHAKILGRILGAKSKSKAFDSCPSQLNSQAVEKLVPFDQKTFEKFYLRKYILDKKMKKFQLRSNYSNDFDEGY